jgi:predicted transposase YbfD/YdcC
MIPLIHPFVSIFASIPDHRQAQGKRHSLTAVLAIVTLALINQQNSIPQIAAWAQGLDLATRKRLPLCRNQVPSESTIRRVLRDLDVQALVEGIQTWVEEAIAAFHPTDQWSGLALDAKTLRGSGDKADNPRALCLLGAFVHELGVFLRSQAIPSHTNELGVVQVFLEDLCLTGRVVTADAIFTQKQVVQTIVEQEGHYLLRVKANQPRLLEDLQTWFEDSSPWSQAESKTCRHTEKGHGRLVRYTLRTTEALNRYLQDELHWPRVGQAFCLERRCTYLRSGKTTTEVHYGITSLSAQQADPPTLLRLWRQHWHIENKGHWVLDVVLAEDHCRVRKDRGPEALAVLRRAVITLLRLLGQQGVTATRATLSANVQRAMSLLGLPLEFY